LAPKHFAHQNTQIDLLFNGLELELLVKFRIDLNCLLIIVSLALVACQQNYCTIVLLYCNNRISRNCGSVKLCKPKNTDLPDIEADLGT